MASRTNTKTAAAKRAAAKPAPEASNPAEAEQPPVEILPADDAPADEPEVEPAPAEDKPALASAPLEPPADPIGDKSVSQVDRPAPAGVMGASLVERSPEGSRLIDARTKEAPDPETLFERFPGPGAAYRCTVRLIEQTFVGPHKNPINRLVMPVNQVVDADRAQRVVNVLRAQLAAAADETE